MAGYNGAMYPDYHEPLYRPPAEAESLIIQATYGCSFNRCAFCAMYRTKRYTARPLAEVLRDIDAAVAGWPDARRVFLADGDALALPADHLRAILDHLAMRLPRLTRVACYATPANIRRKRPGELEQLRAGKLSLFYVGIESGADAILRRIAKGATRCTIAAALRQAHDCGIKVSATVILGLGGEKFWREHIDGTVALLNTAPVNYLSTLQLYLDTSIEADFYARFGGDFTAQDDAALLREQRRLLAAIAPPQPVVFRSNHASNALALEGVLPKERGRLLTQLDEALAGRRPLRPLYLRGM